MASVADAALSKSNDAQACLENVFQHLNLFDSPEHILRRRLAADARRVLKPHPWHSPMLDGYLTAIVIGPR